MSRTHLPCWLYAIVYALLADSTTNPWFVCLEHFYSFLAETLSSLLPLWLSLEWDAPLSWHPANKPLFHYTCCFPFPTLSVPGGCWLSALSWTREAPPISRPFHFLLPSPVRHVTPSPYWHLSSERSLERIFLYYTEIPVASRPCPIFFMPFTVLRCVCIMLSLLLTSPLECQLHEGLFAHFVHSSRT